MKRSGISLFFIFICLIIFPSKAFADKNFKTDLTVIYEYSQDGTSVIHEQYAVTNQTSRYLISNYEYLISGEVPGHLTGQDSRGPLVIQTQKVDSGQNLIRVIFNEVVPGKDRTLNFSLTHDGPPILQSDGIRKIIIPKISNPSDLNAYKVLISVPKVFGLLSYSLPNPDNSLTFSDQESNTYTFSDPSITNQGISAIFGDIQIKKFQLLYLLTNNSSGIRMFKILLPGQTSGQKVYLKTLNPQPFNVVTDTNGDWTAEYQLKGNSNLNVNVTGQVQLSNQYQNLIYHIAPDSGLSEALMPIKSDLSPDVYIEPKEELQINWLPPFQILPFIENQGYLVIKNNGLGQIINPNLVVKSAGFNVRIQSPGNLILLPQGYLKIPVQVNFELTHLFQPKYLSVSANSASIIYNIPYNQFFIIYAIITFFFTFTFLGAAALTFHSWGLHLQKSSRPGNLHRES